MSASLRFRPAVRADIDRLLALREATMLGHLKQAGVGWDRDALMARVLVDFEHAQIVSLDAEDIGLFKARRNPMDWYIVQIQIAPAYQGKGFGDQILRAFLRISDDEGLPVSLSVLKTNPAKRLYDRLGFQIASESETEYLMTRLPASDHNA